MAERRPQAGWGHETDQPPAGRFAMALVGTAVFVPLCALGIWWLLSTLWQAPGPDAPTPRPDAVAPRPGMPAPEDEPAAHSRRLDDRLESYGWVDREAGIAHVPIGRAMDRMVADPPQHESPPAPDNGERNR